MIKKKLRQTLKVHISVMAEWLQLKFETVSAPLQESFHSNSGTIEIVMDA